MVCPLYQAMTAGEFQAAAALPPHPAWMAAHFSPYGPGLSNLPSSFPEGAMLMINDLIPVSNHDPDRIVAELSALTRQPECILLDFQRPGERQTQKVVDAIAQGLSCPVAISHYYQLSGYPVFVPPIPQDNTAESYLSQWKGREIWLELSCQSLCLLVDHSGCREVPPVDADTPEHYNEALYCHYQITEKDERVLFLMRRTRADNLALLEKLPSFGVTKAVGIFQDFR